MSKKTCLAFILTAAAFISCSLFPSHAQEYPCVTLTGDADGNGIVNIDDPTLTQRVLADFVDLSPERTTAADCNRNGVVDVTDVTLMQQYVADMDTRGETVSVPVGLSELLPAYCLREAERVKNSITSEADENDVVFGIFTDTHFSPDDTDLARTQKLNAVRAMRAASHRKGRPRQRPKTGRPPHQIGICGSGSADNAAGCPMRGVSEQLLLRPARQENARHLSGYRHHHGRAELSGRGLLHMDAPCTV